jgi:hypothetical protein
MENNKNSEKFWAGYYHPAYNTFLVPVAGAMFLFGMMLVLINSANSYVLLDSDAAAVIWLIPVWSFMILGCTKFNLARACLKCSFVWTALVVFIGGYIVIATLSSFQQTIPDLVACYGCPHGTDLSPDQKTKNNIPIPLSCPNYYGDVAYQTWHTKKKHKTV